MRRTGIGLGRGQFFGSNPTTGHPQAFRKMVIAFSSGIAMGQSISGNDLAGLTVYSLFFNNNHTISGNALRVLAAIQAGSGVDAATAKVEFPLNLASNVTFVASWANDLFDEVSVLHVIGPLDLNGHDLTLKKDYFLWL
jgi:hypothetical protein